MRYQRKKQYILVYLFIICCATFIFSSCRSHSQVVYNPSEVQSISQQLGFYIKNTDPNIPLYAESSLWLGVPYRYAGLSRKGIDCSGLVHRIYKDLYSQNVSRSTDGLANSGKKISKKKLQPGDLVFFATTKSKKKITHVGIYLKDGYFIHASTSRGVIVSHLDEDYYKKRWRKAMRIK